MNATQSTTTDTERYNGSPAGATSDAERYEGWANRETWAVALHINNDQGWQESVHEALRPYLDALCLTCTEETDGHDATEEPSAWEAGEIIRESVEDYIETLWEFRSDALRNILTDIGSLWRVDWAELGASFLEDVDGEAGASRGVQTAHAAGRVS